MPFILLAVFIASLYLDDFAKTFALVHNR